MNYMLVIQIPFFIGFLVIHIPLPSEQHFVESYLVIPCFLAKLCNHTFVNKCAKDVTNTTPRLFLDECDMHEFNCDHKLKYEVINFHECFPDCPKPPPCKPCNLRSGVANPNKLKSHGECAQHHTPVRELITLNKSKKKFPVKKLKRRQLQLEGRPRKVFQPPTPSSTPLAPTTAPERTETFELKRETVWLKGKMAYRVFKGIREITDKDSSGYLE